MANRIKNKRSSFYRLLTGFVLLILAINASAQSSTQNYIQTIVPRVGGLTSNTAISSNADTNHVMTTITYFDGLGRPIQTVQKQASTSGKDVVQPIAYDPYGREAAKYQPYSITSTTPGTYRPNALTGTGGTYTTSEQYAFYQQTGQPYKNTTAPYAQTGYEPSPLNRVVEQGAPGTSWQFSGPGDGGSSNHTVRAVYTTNDQTSTFAGTPLTNNPGSKIVALYTTTINSSTQTQRLVRTAASYNPGKLSVTITRDENWQPVDGCIGSTETYTDFEGHVVLKRTYNLNAGAVQMISTYYVYDDLGNLAFVLPPQANPDNSGVPAQSVVDNLCYQYNYDQRNRPAAKKLPGKGWEYMIYNTLDQLIATQDSVQRMNNPQQASYIKYDALGREIMTGFYNITSYTVPGVNHRSDLQTNANAQTTLWESRITTGSGYSNSTIPTNGATVLATNYYDDYNIPSLPPGYIDPKVHSSRTLGLPTASKLAVINTPADALWTTHYYDDLGREIHTYRQHYLGGHAGYSLNNYDYITTYYNFTNQVDTTVRQHYTSANTTTTAVGINNNYIYDHMQRKVRTGELINIGTTSGTPVYLSLLEYDELGQLKAKHYHTTDGIHYLGEAGYTYNERGWLSAIVPLGGSTNFGETINYDSPTGTGVIPQFNGNISQFSYNSPYMETHYGNPSSTMNTVNYSYDRLNRLLQSPSTLGVSDESVTYNTNGNILSLMRTSGVTLATIVDTTLAYTYANSGQSNQLTSVTKNGATFKTFTYDANGNALTDGINRNISYNLLSLPQFISIGSTKIDTFTYAADGTKLRNQSAHNGKWDYINGIVYLNGSISFIQTEEGRASIIAPSTIFTYTYDVKDYLGNVRGSFDNGNGNGIPRLVQEDNYYAFGLDQKFYDLSNGNRYLYNKKELQPETGYYDYGNRMYDPVIGRWGVIDGKAELYFSITPYAYAANTPVNAIDPDGHLVIFVAGQNMGSGNGPSYWGGFDKAVQNHFHDVNQNYSDSYVSGGSTDVYTKGAVNGSLYLDGALGGWGNTFNHWGTTPFNLNVDDRLAAGYEHSGVDVGALINSLARTNGVITESIKVVAHSLGAAYARGLIASIVEYAKAHPEECRGLSITEYDFAAFQQNELPAPDQGVTLYQFDNLGDNVVDGFVGSINNSHHAHEKGRDEKGSKDNVNPNGGHSIVDFMSEVSKLAPGKYKYEDGKFVKTD